MAHATADQQMETTATTTTPSLDVSALILRRLYPHVLHLVFAQLSLHDLIQAHATCRTWRHEVATMPDRYASARLHHIFTIDGPLDSDAMGLFLRSDLRRHVDVIRVHSAHSTPSAALVDFLATNRALHEVDFVTYVQSHIVNALLRGLSRSRSLRTLTMHDLMCITHKTTAALVSVIDANWLTSLHVQLTSMGADTIQSIFTSLHRSAHRLQRVEVQARSVAMSHPSPMRALASFVAESRELRMLNLRGCWLGGENTVLLFDSVARSASLTELDVSEIAIGVVEARALSRALAQPGCTIVTLHMRGCELNDSAVEVIANGLGKQPTIIEHVDVSYNNFGDVGTLALCTALAATCPRLHELHLNYINLSSVAAANALGDTIRNCTLHTLVLDGNHSLGGNDIMLTLCMALTTPEKRHLIRHVGLADTMLNDTDALALANMMMLCTQLSSVDMNENEVGPAGAEVIAHVLRNHPSIVEFDMCTTFGEYKIKVESIWSLATAWTYNPYAAKTLTLSAPIDASDCNARTIQQLRQSATDAGKTICFVTADDDEEIDGQNEN